MKGRAYISTPARKNTRHPRNARSVQQGIPSDPIPYGALGSGKPLDSCHGSLHQGLDTKVRGMVWYGKDSKVSESDAGRLEGSLHTRRLPYSLSFCI